MAASVSLQTVTRSSDNVRGEHKASNAFTRTLIFFAVLGRPDGGEREVARFWREEFESARRGGRSSGGVDGHGRSEAARIVIEMGSSQEKTTRAGALEHWIVVQMPETHSGPTNEHARLPTITCGSFDVVVWCVDAICAFIVSVYQYTSRHQPMLLCCRG